MPPCHCVQRRHLLKSAAGVLIPSSLSPSERLSGLHYEHARHLERCGDTGGAAAAYEAAGCGSAEVPRLLLAQGRGDQLERCGWRATALDSPVRGPTAVREFLYGSNEACGVWMA